MPKTDLTPELRRDLQLLKMRNVLDPKRHYKKDNKKGDVPAFSQVGTIIEGATEFYSSRLKNKDRKQTMLEEVIARNRTLAVSSGSTRISRQPKRVARRPTTRR